MEIQSAKYIDENRNYIIVILVDGTQFSVPDSMESRHRVILQKWMDVDPINNVIQDEDPPPAPPTADEIITGILASNEKTQKAFKILVVGLNDGSFVPGDLLSNADLKKFFTDRW